MADAGRLVQLQSFATIEYGTNTVKFTLLDEEGNLINTSRSPLVFTYESIFDKHVFTTKAGDKSVQFVSVLLDVNDEQYTTLKELTRSVANWRTTDMRSLMTTKNPTRPPIPKELMANSMREWHPEGNMLASVSHVLSDRAS